MHKYGRRTSNDFPPGWNGLAKTPFTGWRSWYAFYTSMNQSIIEGVIDALAARNRTVKGWEGKVSLCDLGYCAAGIDEGWEGCGLGANGTQHYVNGTPATNTHNFPDMKGLVNYGAWVSAPFAVQFCSISHFSTGYCMNFVAGA